ncbi:hypothetical protein D0T60_05050 [Bacteroides sp. 224]|nr:hypothetical protein [Bacteroides sp. 224]
MHLKIKILLWIIAIPLLTACEKKTPSKEISFYYWKRNVTFGKTEKDYFRKLNCEKLYIRFFDIDVDSEDYLSPKSKIALFNPKELDAKYIPVVFITNRTFRKMEYSSPESLANSTHGLIEKIVEKNKIPSPDEIQIDCDWTTSTRENFFTFLRELKKLFGGKITCTLRLHQVKDMEMTGVPPVDKVYLMCYATSSPQDTDTQNSILDIELLKAYTGKLHKYPVELDVALPLYSWGVVTNHRGEIRLINNVDITDMVPEFFKQTGENTYEAQDDFFLQGIYLNKGFTLRIERIDPALLNEAKSYLDSKLKKNYHIVYYHLDKPFIERFTIDELK